MPIILWYTLTPNWLKRIRKTILFIQLKKMIPLLSESMLLKRKKIKERAIKNLPRQRSCSLTLFFLELTNKVEFLI
jgi:hypothetical protein